MARYAIWNKQDPVITPIGEVLMPEQWMARYPVAALENITVVCAAGEVNGGFFSTLGQLVQIYENEGCDFSACETAEDKLAAIEAFEDAKKAAGQEAVTSEELTATSLASIAASLEYQNLLTLEDEEVQA